MHFVHNYAVQQLLPPCNVRLVEQSIDPLTQSLRMVVKWDPVDVESSSDVTGYAVYVDSELYSNLIGVENTQAELSGLVPKVSNRHYQLLKLYLKLRKYSLLLCVLVLTMEDNHVISHTH